MATGRSLPEFEQLFIDGYPMCAYTISIDERGIEYPEYDGGVAICDPIKGVLVGKPTVIFGPVNGTFDNTATSGMHVLANAAQGARRNILHVRGVRGTPAMGDDTFTAQMLQSAYKAVGDDIVSATLQFGHDATSALAYDEVFGRLIHAYGSETGANSANTNVDNGAATAYGGYLMYQIYSITGSGTVTVSIDDSANGTTWAALSGATTGAIATASAPTSGVIELATNATVRQYLRWQLAFGGSASACTFALAFVRGRNQG